MTERDYLGRAGGEGDSPEQQKAIDANTELQEQTGQPEQQQDQQEKDQQDS